MGERGIYIYIYNIKERDGRHLKGDSFLLFTVRYLFMPKDYNGTLLGLSYTIRHINTLTNLVLQFLNYGSGTSRQDSKSRVFVCIQSIL